MEQEALQAWLPWYALIVASALVVGETLILIRTDKYWPLSIDDYLVAALLFYSVWRFETNLGMWLMLLAWGMMIGNLYAMLFTRMEPDRGSRERLGLLSVLLVVALIGAGLTLARIY